MITRKPNRPFFCILLFSATFFWYLCATAQTADNQTADQQADAPQISQPPGSGDPGQMENFLYFIHPDQQHLTARPIYFPAESDEYTLGVELLTILLQGPRDKTLTSAWPPGTKLRAFFMGENGKTWVDLALEKGADGGEPFAQTDTTKELLAVYSLVHSLCLNLQQVNSVKILINGSDRHFLGRHVCLESFYTPDMALVK